MIAFMREKSVFDVHEEFCRSVRIGSKFGGQIIFPGISDPAANGMTYLDGVTVDSGILRSPNIQDGKILLYVGGCVDYQFATDGERHQTQFLFQVTAGENNFIFTFPATITRSTFIDRAFLQEISMGIGMGAD